MKFGVADYGMQVWYGGNYNVERRLHDLKSIGFDGIERLEAIEAADAMNQAAVFHKMGMDFATCRAPQIAATFQWTAAMGKEYVWITPGPQDRKVEFDVFCRRTNEFLKVCADHGLKGALHNHLGNRVETHDELDAFMEKCPDACLLLDVGHLHGAGGDNVKALNDYHDRLAAIHFKDVFYKDHNAEAWYDRLRFCELGGGNADMDFAPICDALKKYGYDKWILVEHDTHLNDPLVDLKKSLDILKKLMA